MKRLLVDLNVVLDVLLERAPHSAAASALWAAREHGECELVLPAHGVTTIFYLATRQRDAAFARAVVTDLTVVFEIAAVDEAVIRRALALEMSDFEDAVTAAAGERAGCDALVTRNLSDFSSSPLLAIDPATALAWIETSRAAEETPG